MGDLVNLKRFKKRNEKEQSRREADANRAKFGLTKLERARNQQNKDRINRVLDQHRIDDGEAS
jgi:hypothetical protein